MKYSVDYTGFDEAKTRRIEDYRTGEALSVKSNQLAYIPPYAVTEDTATGKAYVSWPTILQTQDGFKDFFNDLTNIPVVKTVVSGKPYYFYDFTKKTDSSGNLVNVDMSEYIQKYAKLFTVPAESDPGTRSIGDLADLYNITSWNNFKVGSIIIDETGSNKLYTNSAISVKNEAESTLRIISGDKNNSPLKKVNDDLQLSKYDKAKNESLMKDTDVPTAADAAVVSSDLRDRYKTMKALLTDNPKVAAKKNAAVSASEKAITPINTYFDFTKLNSSTAYSSSETRVVDTSGEVNTLVTGTVNGSVKLQSNYTIFMSDKDVTVKADAGSGGIVKGVVICKGDVDFDSNVDEFHGLIVAGGKIKVVDDNKINFVANPEIVKSVINECQSSTKKPLKDFIALFKDYNSTADGSTGDNATSMKSVASVQYEDVLGFNNWQKNVD